MHTISNVSFVEKDLYWKDSYLYIYIFLKLRLLANVINTLLDRSSLKILFFSHSRFRNQPNFLPPFLQTSPLNSSRQRIPISVVCMARMIKAIAVILLIYTIYIYSVCLEGVSSSIPRTNPRVARGFLFFATLRRNRLPSARFSRSPRPTLSPPLL